MQRAEGRLTAQSRAVEHRRGWGLLGVLALTLTASGCVGGAQLANMIEVPETTVAFEAIEGPPAAIIRKLTQNLEQEAHTRQAAVVPLPEANYRVRGYLAAHADGSATAIAWTFEAYGADRRRVFRVSGEEKGSGPLWAAANEEVLKRIARTSMQQFVALAASGPGTAPDVTRPPQPSLVAGWFDDWAPEASGIFRIFQRELPRPEIAADAGRPLPADQVPLPRARPVSSAAPSGAALAFAAQDR